MGEQQRYQKWFMQRWGLQTPEGESLIADLVRFICSVHHPPNEVIRSNVVQRWAAVGWLLKCAKTATCKANIKLAIFYDWLFFTPRIDSVMNVEPAALLIIAGCRSMYSTGLLTSVTSAPMPAAALPYKGI